MKEARRKELKITRGFSVPTDYEGIMYDIGGGCFDHHQKDRRIRENRIPYAAFGLLWEKFGECLLCGENAYEAAKLSLGTLPK